MEIIALLFCIAVVAGFFVLMGYTIIFLHDAIRAGQRWLNRSLKWAKSINYKRLRKWLPNRPRKVAAITNN